MRAGSLFVDELHPACRQLAGCGLGAGAQSRSHGLVPQFGRAERLVPQPLLLFVGLVDRGIQAGGLELGRRTVLGVDVCPIEHRLRRGSPSVQVGLGGSGNDVNQAVSKLTSKRLAAGETP